MVGATGFEPVTTRTPSVCATRLRHAPHPTRLYYSEAAQCKGADWRCNTTSKRHQKRHRSHSKRHFFAHGLEPSESFPHPDRALYRPCGRSLAGALIAALPRQMSKDAPEAEGHPQPGLPRSLAELLTPESILPEQFFSGPRKDADSSPERALMLAVLEDGIRCFQQFMHTQSVRRRMLARQAERWIRRRDDDWPFSFDNVCGTLGIDSSNLRRALLRMKYECLTGNPKLPGKSNARRRGRQPTRVMATGEGIQEKRVQRAPATAARPAKVGR